MNAYGLLPSSNDFEAIDALNQAKSYIVNGDGEISVFYSDGSWSPISQITPQP